MKRTILIVVVAIAVTLSSAVAGQTPRRPGMSTAEEQEILNFKLTMPLATKLLAAIPDMSRYVMERPDATAWLQKSVQQTRDEQVGTLEADLKAMAILRKHGLSAREYTVGVIAVRGAILKAQNPESPVARNIPTSPENIAFAKANISVLGPKLAEADEMGMKMLMKR